MPAYSSTSTTDTNSGTTVDVNVHHQGGSNNDPKYLVDVHVVFPEGSGFVLDGGVPSIAPPVLDKHKASGTLACRWAVEIDPSNTSTSQAALKLNIKTTDGKALLDEVRFLVAVSTREKVDENYYEWHTIQPTVVALPKMRFPYQWLKNWPFSGIQDAGLQEGGRPSEEA